MNRLVTRVLALTTLAALAACSGGGSSAVPHTGAHAASATGRATLTIKRLVPQASLSAAKRRAQEFSTGANALVVDATQSGTSVLHQVFDVSGAVIDNGLNCTYDNSGEYQLCSGQIRLPAGAVTLTLATNDARDGSGKTLGTATVPLTINAATDNPISVTLDGVAASLRLAVSDPAPPTGSTATLAVTAQIYDADGFVFIAPQNYATPVTISDGDASASTQLFTRAVQNSTQRYNGTPVPTATSAPGKTVTIPDRYTQAYLTYDGTLSTPFTLTATLGSLSASATVTPSSPATRTAGSSPNTYAWPANSARGYDPVFDASGNLWVTRSGGSISSIDPSTHQPTATYTLPPTSVRTLRAAVLGPDGGIYMVSGTVSNGAATAPWYVTRFDTVAHTFTDFATSDEVFSLVAGPGGMWGVERTLGKLWHLPVASGSAPGTPAELALALPSQKDATPALASLPSWIGPSSDGNLWVVEMSLSGLNGTWIAKVSPTGTKMSEALVLPNSPASILAGIASDGSDNIWLANIGNGNEFVKLAAGTGTATTYVVPRLYGNDTWSLLTHYAAVDGGGNLWFVSYQDNRIGRVDGTTGRVDFITGPAGNVTYGVAIGSNGTIAIPEYSTSTAMPGLYTNTAGVL